MSSLISYFPNYLANDSLFTQMAVLGAPWDSDIGQDMDDAYFTMYSGLKPASQFVKLHSTNSVANALTIARVVLSMYKEPWQRLWDAYKKEYDPIQNYNLDDTTTRHLTNDRTVGVTTEDKTVDSSTDTINYGENIDKSGTLDMYNFGFNSTERVPTNTQDETGNESHSGSDTTTSSGTSTSNGISDTTDNDVEDETITRNRAGNVGQNSYQELLRQEFELWRWNFYYRVFEDVDRFLVLSVYDPCLGVISTNPVN